MPRLPPAPGRFFHVELLPQAFRKFLRKQARGRVVCAAGRDRHDHAQRPARIALRPTEPCNRWSGDNGPCNAERTATAQFRGPARWEFGRNVVRLDAAKTNCPWRVE